MPCLQHHGFPQYSNSTRPVYTVYTRKQVYWFHFFSVFHDMEAAGGIPGSTRRDKDAVYIRTMQELTKGTLSVKGIKRPVHQNRVNGAVPYHYCDLITGLHGS